MTIDKVVPFFAVKDMEKSLAYYVDGLGFEMQNKWEKDGKVLWCHLKHGGAGLMLQEFKTEGHDSRQFSDNRGEGVSLFFFCDDAVAYYREISSRGLEVLEPSVGNGLWVTEMKDPDGYELAFESPTDVAEGTKLSEVE